MLGHLFPGFFLNYLWQELVLDNGFQSKLLYLVVCHHLSPILVSSCHLLAALQRGGGGECFGGRSTGCWRPLLPLGARKTASCGVAGDAVHEQGSGAAQKQLKQSHLQWCASSRTEMRVI